MILKSEINLMVGEDIMRFKLNKRKMMATIMAGSLLVSYVVPTMAQEMTWHKWSTSTLVEGEKYGIYPLSWYDNMQAEMDGKALQAYCEAIGKKLEAIPGVRLKENLGERAYASGVVTRKEVLESIYKVLNQYDYPSEVKLGDDAITYMHEKQILMGTGKTLELDKTCTLEEAAMFGTRIINVFYKELNAGAKGLLWKVQKGNNTVYMLGSVHIANYGVYPFSNKVLEAYQSSDVLGVELNFYNEEGSKDYNKIAYYLDGTTLKDHIPADLYKEVVEASEKIGMSEADIASYKPWCIANAFSATALSKSSTVEEQQVASLLGIDNYFMTNALVNDVPIYELESYAYQANLFEGFSQQLQEHYLASATEMILDEKAGSEGADMVQGWLEYWQEGDLEKFEKDFPKKQTDKEATKEEQAMIDEYNNKLWTIRDISMTEKIEDLLNSTEGKTYFIVVGSGHYVGEDGVIQNLKNKGYTVEQIK